MTRISCRFHCFLIVLALLFSIPSLSSAAIQRKNRLDYNEDLFWYLDEDGLLTISGTGKMKDLGEEQHSPWDYFKVKKVVIEDGVTGIGNRAFADCYYMKSIEIPESVAYIGDYAFYRCYRLETISLPDNLVQIGANPFVFCSSLTEIELSPDHPVLSFSDGMLSCVPEHRLVCMLSASPLLQCTVPEGIQVIGDYAFAYCETLGLLFIPEGVSVIGNHAFSGCEGLTIHDFPQSLLSVGDYAFSGCRLLFSAHFKEGLTSIGSCAFAYCWYLSRIDLPDTLSFLGNHPFDDCRCLSEINISEDHPLLGIKDGILFNKSSMKMIFYLAENPAESFVVPQGIATIGEKAFTTGHSLKTITLPDSVKKIESDAFWNCDVLEEIIFSNGLEVVDEGAFHHLSHLKEAILPEGLVSIGDYAFAGCSELEKVLIPVSVERIGEEIFTNVDTLNLVVFIAEGSLGDQYCRQNSLRSVGIGQEIPDLEVELPREFAALYPGYKGVSILWTKDKEAVYLARTPEGTLVLLCGASHGKDGRKVVESTPLPSGARVVKDDGLVLLDVGSAECNICRYYEDSWGIESVGWGWNAYFFNPKWIGYYGPLARFFGINPWADLTTIDWSTLSDDFDLLLKGLDLSSCAFAYRDDPEGRIPIYVSPDQENEKIADLFVGAPLFILEKGKEWTHVFLGRDVEYQWKLEGWIRTEDLEFREKADPDHYYQMNPWLYSPRDRSITLVTPLGNEEVSGINDGSFETWFPIGEKTVDGREYWLFYETETEQIGFILKEDLCELIG